MDLRLKTLLGPERKNHMQIRTLSINWTTICSGLSRPYVAPVIQRTGVVPRPGGWGTEEGLVIYKKRSTITTEQSII